MPLMTQEQLDLLGAEAGAYSFVTAREATGDKSITLDSNEKKYLLPIIIYSTFHVVELFKPAIVKIDDYFIF